MRLKDLKKIIESLEESNSPDTNVKLIVNCEDAYGVQQVEVEDITHQDQFCAFYIDDFGTAILHFSE